jgi:hypothetical protein
MTTEIYKDLLYIPKLKKRFDYVYHNYGFDGDLDFSKFVGIHETTINRTKRGGFQEWPNESNTKRILECLFEEDCEEASELIALVYQTYGFVRNKKLFGEAFNFRLQKPYGWACAIRDKMANDKKPSLLQNIMHYVDVIHTKLKGGK